MSGRHKINKLKSTVIVCAGSALGFSGLCFYQNNEKFYDNVLLPVAHSLDPELSHRLAVKFNKYGLIPKSKFTDKPLLTSTVWNISFKNPIGMAAGFDKDAEAIEGLLKIGFGFVEVGSITPLPQEGNKRPRVFRLSSNKAIINRYGFNSEGHEVVLRRVKAARKEYGAVGVNLGKNKESEDPVGDYAKGIKLFSPHVDYLVINISSPNTPGLREWQRKEQLEELLTKLKKVRDEQPIRPPLLLKLAPDLTVGQAQDIANLLLKPHCQMDGLVISNTSTSRPATLEGNMANEAGGLSGAPISKAATFMIATMYQFTKGEIPIIGVGGVFTGEDALEKIKAGASLIQLYTAFVYHGPPRITRLKNELTKLLEDQGFKSIKEAVGIDSKVISSQALEESENLIAQR